VEGPRFDAWANPASGLGIPGLDKAVGIRFASQSAVPRNELSELYRFDGIASKIVDRPVWDSVRQGWSIDVQGDEEADGDPIDVALADTIEPLELRTVYTEARKWARLYGDALIIAGLDDVDPDDPRTFALPATPGANPLWFEVVAAGYMGPVQAVYSDPADPSKVTHYQINPHGKQTSTLLVDASRTWLVRGVQLPDEIAQQNDSWDDSVIQRVYQALTRVATADGTGVTFLSERQYPVFRVDGLIQRMVAKGPASVMARFQQMATNKSIYRAVVLDKGKEEFDVMETSAAGISDLLNIYPNRVAAVSNIPVTILYGTSPGGLNATGQSDFQGYYDFVEGSEQAEHLEPFLRWSTTLVMQGSEGPTAGVVLPFTVRFNPLTTPTAKEIADTRNVQANTDNTYWTMGALSSEEIRASRFGGTEFGDTITIDTEAVDAFEAAAALEGAEAEALGLPASSEAVAALSSAEAREQDVTAPLNGAQITAALEVTAGVTNSQIPPLVGVELLVSVGIDRARAAAMIEAAAAFTPTTPIEVTI
jgi:phage-related protein (TIGR01555 family)